LNNSQRTTTVKQKSALCLQSTSHTNPSASCQKAVCQGQITRFYIA